MLTRKPLPQLAVVVAAASVIGGFVGGAMSGGGFSWLGAFVAGVGTPTALLGLGAYFDAQEKRRIGHLVPVRPTDLRSVEDVAEQNVTLLLGFADRMVTEAYADTTKMSESLGLDPMARMLGDAVESGRAWFQLYALALFLIVRSKGASSFSNSPEYRTTRRHLLRSMIKYQQGSLMGAMMDRNMLISWLTEECNRVEGFCVDFGRELAAGNTSTPAKALVRWLTAQTAIKTVGGDDMHKYTLEQFRLLQPLLTR